MATLRTRQTQKQKLSHTMRSWLPILQADIEELPQTLESFKEANPFLEIKSGNENSHEAKFKKKNFFQRATQNSVSDSIEALSIKKESLYDVLFKQINPPLFPTQKSQDIAYKIIHYINDEGYFEYDDEIFKTYAKDEIEKVRARFAYLEPVGIGAVDFKEALLFQLDNCDIKSDFYPLVKEMLDNFENIQTYTKKPHFNEIMEYIKYFRIPPALEYMEDSKQIIPDIFIDTTNDHIQVSINDEYYPQILLDIEGLDKNDEYINEKVKDAKDLIDALEMRKSTLYKVGLNIIENQYDFFYGGALKPMTIRGLAKEMDRNPSTISRAIANKYLSCDMGVYALKDFFTTAIDEETSNSSLKEFIKQSVEYENHLKPLSDMKLLKMIQSNFNTTLSRRTITKYRKQLNIAGSSERKRLYQLQG